MKKSELKELVKEEIQNLINELDIEDGNDDNEGEVTKSELLSIAKDAQKISEKITDDKQPIEAWVQSHISAAKELISHAADYIAGESEESEESDEDGESDEVGEKEDSAEEPEVKETPEQLQEKEADKVEKKEFVVAKVKKSDVSKVKDMAKEFAAKGEHVNILKMVKKLENYLKTHIKKETE